MAQMTQVLVWWIKKVDEALEKGECGMNPFSFLKEFLLPFLIPFYGEPYPCSTILNFLISYPT